MKKSISLVLATLITIATGVAAAAEESRPSDDLRTAEGALESVALDEPIDPLCTISCSFWNTCRLLNMSKPESCGDEPPGCNCTSFRDRE